MRTAPAGPSDPDRKPRRRRPAVAPLALLVGAALTLSAACTASTGSGGGAAAPSTAAPPGTAGAPPSFAPPGTLIEATPITGAPGARAWRIVYHSQAADGHDVAVTGTLQTPDPAPAAAATGLPVITWAHPTTGSADSCAPSRKGTADLPFATAVLAKGWATVATDYEGLGTRDPHPYLVGASEGHAVLDAVRAAAQVDTSGVTAASPVTVWGFSQGGHAAAFAGQLAPTYAPDLTIKGVLIAAPVSDVDHFARRAEKIPSQFGVLVTVVGGLRAAYPELDVSTVFSPQVQAEMGELERECIGEVNTYFDRPIGPMLVRSPSEEPAFATRLAENQAGRAAIPAPILVIQGALDDIVDPADTAAMVARYCALGVTVQSIVKPDTKHGVMDTEPALSWTSDRFADAPAPSTC